MPELYDVLPVGFVHVTTCVRSVPCLAQYIRTDFFGIRVGFTESYKVFVGYS
jgi:hypothetical protein